MALFSSSYYPTCSIIIQGVRQKVKCQAEPYWAECVSLEYYFLYFNTRGFYLLFTLSLFSIGVVSHCFIMFCRKVKRTLSTLYVHLEYFYKPRVRD
jgi:hypothetical protein